ACFPPAGGRQREPQPRDSEARRRRSGTRATLLGEAQCPGKGPARDSTSGARQASSASASPDGPCDRSVRIRDRWPRVFGRWPGERHIAAPMDVPRAPLNYWLCQVAGWGLYGAVEAVGAVQMLGLPLGRSVLEITVWAAGGMALTHVLRGF